MTVDPHQVHNLAVPAVTVTAGIESVTTFDPDKNLPLLNKLSRLLATLGDCEGSECYEIGGEHLESLIDDNDEISSKRRTLTLEFMQESIRNRIPCHNPPNMTTGPGININQRRKQFAYDLPVPEPFTYGFPFSDGDNVGEDLLQIWTEYEHYFH